ncbi:MAG TPA: HAD-IA family hydrolase [Thermoplasmata archaeon]|nr:HAD-IA family hydrolase [Thermoplasmata archaeon]
MGDPTVVLWDIGGVLLSNGFDDADRAAAAARFGLDLPEFERRHHETLEAFERGQLSLDDYLDVTVFYTPRAFRREDVKSFIFGCSTPHPEVIELARAVAATPGRLTGCLNNESRELNDFRLRTFGLDRFLSVRFSSCYTGRRKPDLVAYRLAADVLGRPPADIVFIDDRAENVAPAATLGFRAIQYHTPAQLRTDLDAVGVHW